MSKSTTKRLRAINGKNCGCYHCLGHDLPNRTQRKRAWRRYELAA